MRTRSSQDIVERSHLNSIHHIYKRDYTPSKAFRIASTTPVPPMPVASAMSASASLDSDLFMLLRRAVATNMQTGKTAETSVENVPPPMATTKARFLNT
mmetsp:Transcript_18365/g.36990  ORF Transcript_18365/g.36990 Transcript_18365/m.36990 type:complete len:99 (-) Transcript_18365:175-471(-)